MKRDFQIEFLKSVGLKPEHKLFEIGCGTLRGGIPIIEHLNRNNYHGMDVSLERVNEGIEEVLEHNLEYKNPSLTIAQRLSKIRMENKLDYIWAFSVLIHMDDKSLEDALFFVKKNISEHGKFYANINEGYKNKKGEWEEFPVVERPISFYRDKCESLGLHVSDMGPIKKFGHRSGVKSQDSQRMLEIELG